MAFVGGVCVAVTIMILIENVSLKNQLQSLKDERQKLMSQVNDKSFKEQLGSFDELENHINDVIIYTELKEKKHLTVDEKQKMISLDKNIEYDVDIDHSYKRTKELLNIMKNLYNKCKKLVDAGNMNIDENDKLFKDFANEIDKLRQTEGKSTAVGSGLWTRFTSALYEWSTWLLNKIKDLLAT